MNPARIAWGVFALTMVLVPTGFVLNTIGGQDTFFIYVVFQLFFAAVQLTTACVGAVVASRLPGNRVGWILLAIGAGLGVRQALGGWGGLGAATAGGLPGDDVAAWMTEWVFILVIAGGVVFLLHLFPNGRFMSRRWRLVGIASGAIVVLVTVASALRPGQLNSVEEFENPLAVTGALADLVAVALAFEGPLALFAFGGAAAAIVVRLRRSTGVERQQIKWIVYTLTLVAVGLAATAVFPVSAAYPLLFAMLALAATPVAAGVAILRYRLYDIDVVINRTLVYGALTATLAGTYLGSVLLLQLVLSGVTANSGLAVAGSTLAVAALFRPARGHIQATVDRRFYRRKYDAVHTLQQFGAHLRDEVDLDTLGGELRAVVADTMQPAHVSLWLRETRA